MGLCLRPLFGWEEKGAFQATLNFPNRVSPPSAWALNSFSFLCLAGETSMTSTSLLLGVISSAHLPLSLSTTGSPAYLVRCCWKALSTADGAVTHNLSWHGQVCTPKSSLMRICYRLGFAKPFVGTTTWALQL